MVEFANVSDDRASKSENQFQIQRDNHTSFDRYPNTFRAAASLCAGIENRPLKILSFGCSTGQECACLATKYFPFGTIVGLDTNPDVLNSAKDLNSLNGKITYDISTEENIRSYGPFDAIFAMSVLCSWPVTRDMANIDSVFPFHKYETIIKCLDSNLRIGGILVINNSNFNFLDVDVSRNYQVVLTPAISNNGNVKRFTRRGTASIEHRGSDSIYRKIRDCSIDSISDGRNIEVIDEGGRVLGTLSLSLSM